MVTLLILFFYIITYLFTKSESEKNVFLLFLIILAGILKSQIDFHYLPASHITNVRDTKENELIKLSGIISEIHFKDTEKIRFVLETEKIYTKNDTFPVSGDILVYLKEKPIEPLEVGYELLLSGRLLTPGKEANPGEFNYKQYLTIHNIYKLLIVDDIYLITVINRDVNLNFISKAILNARKYSNKNINIYTGGDEGELLKGLVTGDRDGISEEVKDTFVKAGVMHIVAVSGLNVAYVIIAVNILLSLFKIPKKIRYLITIVFLILYVIFTGYPPSIIRAAIMGIVILLSFLVQRKPNIYNSLGLSAIIILVIDSKQLFDSGFVLSYIATFSVVYFYEIINKRLIQKIKFNTNKILTFFRPILLMLTVTVAAQIGTVLVSAHYFEKISFVSFFTNLVIVPLSNLSLALGFVQILLSTVSDFLASSVAASNKLLLSFILLFTRFAAQLPYAFITVYRIDLITIIIYYFSILILIFANKDNFLPRLIIVLLIILFKMIISIKSPELKIIFISTRTGESTLVTTPGGKSILINLGMISDDIIPAEKFITPVLQREGINKLDALIITDNKIETSSIRQIFSNFEIKNCFTPATCKYYDPEIDTILNKNTVTIKYLEQGDIVTIDEITKLYILSPQQKDSFEIKSKFMDFLLKCNNLSVFFAGGNDSIIYRKIALTYGGILKSSVLKLGQAGSSKRFDKLFFDIVDPNFTIVFPPNVRYFRLPSKSVLKYIETKQKNIIQIKREGAVIFKGKETELSQIQWRQ
ncbi:MAG: ComEC/Rec2 family competence protein [Ignavibacteria bacterium]